MPLGPAHTSATVVTSGLACLAAAALIYQTQRVEWLMLPVGAMAGLLLSPDLDINNGSISDYHARRIGCLFAFVWYWYWRPYAWVMKHRGVSHAPILGTAVRLVYCFWWMPLVVNPLPWAWIATGAAGLAIVDLLHIFMDRV